MWTSEAEGPDERGINKKRQDNRDRENGRKHAIRKRAGNNIINIHEGTKLDGNTSEL